ncbi:LysE family translocator [Marinomonas rhizomae]|uniref:Threonine/homoserine/homoserine lactone efflux protein n=1 Tax=Marinomonas rhizomae TaxID=491948 RepID=A0A366J221_9GAMM|nr:LysE family translocator [Marinomonas rhizomae]RBP81113.1 threonine/homoserine/homoserine lactone efflux protein [Marinomonas rhizomae]RNF72272.1 LysE family translocator [Marinomonas rhizomae]
MSIEVWLAFVVASITMLVIPGPTILAVIANSVAHGRRANIPLVVGVALGDTTALLASLVGLGALFSVSAFWFTVVKGIGGLYLLYLGFKLLRSGASPMKIPSSDKLTSKWRLFLNTYIVTTLNPKGIIFFVAFLPQFVSHQGNTTEQLFILAVTFVMLATLSASTYAFFALRARTLLSSEKAMRGFNLAGGSLMSIAGIWALFAKRTVS